MSHTKALLFIDDNEAKVFESHIRLQQLVRANDDVDLATFYFLKCGQRFLLRFEARKDFDFQRPIGEAVAERPVMLFRQQRRGHQHRDLLATRRGDERGAHGDFGLAEADIAANHAVHWLRRRQVADNRFDRRVLVWRFFEREAGGEGFVH